MRAGEGWRHPYLADERKETPFRIEALYKVARGFGDRDVFYFEGLKHYADPRYRRELQRSRARIERHGREPASRRQRICNRRLTGQAPRDRCYRNPRRRVRQRRG